MSTMIQPSTTQLSGLTFGGMLRSEWIKLRSLRSTVWCLSILVFLTIAIGLLLAATLNLEGVTIDQAGSQSFAVQAATLSIGFSQLVVVVLGCLVITGEYSTGMIRSTFASVPSRVPAIAAKAIIFAVSVFVVSLVSILATIAIAAPLLAGKGVTVDFSDGALWGALIGAAGYLALIGVFALMIGTIIRNSAGAIAAALGMILVLPTVLQVFTAITESEAVGTASALLPSAAGARMYAYVIEGEQSFLPGLVLEPWQGALVLLAWVVALGALALVLVKRRDA